MKAIYFFENDDLIYSIDDRNYIGIDIYLPETNIMSFQEMVLPTLN
jgi:hypothetical protein